MQPEPISKDVAAEAEEQGRQATRDKRPLLMTKARMDVPFEQQVDAMLAEIGDPGAASADALAAQAKAAQLNKTCCKLGE